MPPAALAALAAGLLAFAAGCRERPAAEKPRAESAAPSPENLREAALSLAVGDEKDLDALLAKHRGKVVLVDFWATWCTPCIAAFPHTVRLHRELADRGLAVIGVSLDDPDSNRDQVTAFLTEQGAGFDNLISRHGNSTASVRAFAIPHGAVPHLRVYDRAGKLRASLPPEGKELAPGDAERAVRALLAEPVSASAT